MPVTEKPAGGGEQRFFDRSFLINAFSINAS